MCIKLLMHTFKSPKHYNEHILVINLQHKATQFNDPNVLLSNTGSWSHKLDTSLRISWFLGSSPVKEEHR